jgi:hypothetical protein
MKLSIMIANALFKFLMDGSIKNFKEIIWLLLAIAIELYARVIASIDYHLIKKVPYKWEIIKSARY